jgi:hypothetical protein
MDYGSKKDEYVRLMSGSLLVSISLAIRGEQSRFNDEVKKEVTRA